MVDVWLGRYNIEASLGGAHYAVYRAHDQQTHSRVVLKVMREECLASDASFRAFWSDTRVRSTLHCQALPRVLAYGFAPRPWSASEWIEGFPLQVVLGAGDNALRAAMMAVMEGAETLAAAGVLASDCHPSNWLLAKSRAVYVDCGDVAQVSDAATLRKELGDLFYFLAVGRDASGRWADTFRGMGVNIAPPPEPSAVRPELKTSSALIVKLRGGEAIGKSHPFSWASPAPVALAPFGRAVEVADATPFLAAAHAEGVDCVRLSPVARIETDGFVHVSRYKKLTQWLDAHALAQTPVVVTCESAVLADAETQAAIADLRTRVTRQPLLFVST